MRYIGNKTRLLEHINDFISENEIDGDIFCDLFAGTGAVGDFFKSKYNIISNDFMYYSYAINKAKILNNDIPKFENFRKVYHKCPFEYLNEKNFLYKDNYFITSQYSPKNNRQYFTEENSIIIDGIRIEIEELYKKKLINNNEYYYLLASLIESVMSISNTSGTYEAFLKNWDKRAFKQLKILPLEINKVTELKNNKVYCQDSNLLIRNIKGDILYIDTPYTITEYSSAYHLLETIAKYDYPDINGITGRRTINTKKSDYSKKKKALFAFEDLIRQAQFKDIIISYSSQGIIDLDELVFLLKKFSINNEVIIKEIPYREYKNLNSSKKGKTLNEVLIYIKKDLNIIKSPLNYSGSKDNIVSDIVKVLPKHIDTFFDVMGGAFNVGANITAMDKVIYNDYNYFVVDILKLILNSDKHSLIERIEEIIKNFNLEKSNKENFIKFRNYYNNKDKSPLILFILQMFCFQNQLRFNSKLEFNTPVGNCSYNETTAERIKKFVPKTNKYFLYSMDFLEINYSEFNKDTVFYFDPPYFITNATYNDGKRGFKGWSADLETKLLEKLTELNNLGYKFILSNVIEHRGKVNYLLNEWIKTHNFKIIEIKHCTRKEVLIINY